MTSHPVTSPPVTLRETIVANCRLQPAIPAALVMLLLVLLPAMSSLVTEGKPAVWTELLIAAGIAASAGLAVAAGFCSFAPQAIWLALAVWAASLLQRAELSAWLLLLLGSGAVAVLGMIGVQFWRVRSGRFIPTVRRSVAPDAGNGDGQ